MKNINICVAGDLYLGRGVEKMAIKEPASLFGQGVKTLFSGSDVRMLNLESVITSAGDDCRIVKTGPHLKASGEGLNTLRELDINLVTLANNHIFDYGALGLKDTLTHLSDMNVDFVGAGLTLKDARQTYFKELGGKKMAIINFAENEWSNANENQGGANPMDLIENTKSIQEAKSNSDFVLIIVHGGHENYQYPSPRMVKQYRYYVDQGADAVICHHAHRTSGFEEYKGVPIFYGIGNFLFDSKSNLPGWNNGIIVKLELSNKGTLNYSIHPYEQCNGQVGVKLLNGEKEKEARAEIDLINAIISDADALQEKFDDFCHSQRDLVLGFFSNSNIFDFRYFRSAVRRFGLEKFFLRKNQIKSIMNYARCEAHKDITYKVLSNYLNKK